MIKWEKKELQKHLIKWIFTHTHHTLQKMKINFNEYIQFMLREKEEKKDITIYYNRI